MFLNKKSVLKYFTLQSTCIRKACMRITLQTVHEIRFGSIQHKSIANGSFRYTTHVVIVCIVCLSYN